MRRAGYLAGLNCSGLQSPPLWSPWGPSPCGKHNTSGREVSLVDYVSEDFPEGRILVVVPMKKECRQSGFFFFFSHGWGLRADVTNDTNWVACNYRDLSSHSSGAQESEVKVSAGPCSLQRPYGRFFPRLPQLLIAPGAPWRVAASVFPWPSSLCVSPLSWSKDTCHRT